MPSASSSSEAVAARRAGQRAAGEVGTQRRGEGRAARELGDGAGCGGGGELGAVKEGAAIRAAGGGGRGGGEEAADGGVEVGGRVPFLGAGGALLLAEPRGWMDGLAGVAGADGNRDRLEFLEGTRGSRGEFRAQDLGGHLRAAGQVLAQDPEGCGGPDASGGRHGWFRRDSQLWRSREGSKTVRE